jgi:DNA replication protein DnaC
MMDEPKRFDFGPILERIKTKLVADPRPIMPQDPGANLPEGYKHARWENLARADQLRAMLKRLNSLSHDESEWPLYIHGKPGTGKTCIAALIYGAYKRRPMWRRADELLIEIGTSRADGYAALKEKLQKSPCVFMDDLGVRQPTEAMTQAMFDLMELRARRAMVIVSNHTPDALAKIYDERIVSRITAGTTLYIGGKDQRVGKGKRYQLGGGK